MKTPSSSTKVADFSLLQTLKTLGILFLLGSLASCSSKSSSVTYQPSHWHKVRSTPPTYFPKGVPANHPTGLRDGSWVFTGDKAKTRYFIPLRGVASNNLITEARATMTANKRRKLKKEGGNDWPGKKMVKAGLFGFGEFLLRQDERTFSDTGRAAEGGAIHDAQNQLRPSR